MLLTDLLLELSVRLSEEGMFAEHEAALVETWAFPSGPEFAGDRFAGLR